MIQDAAITRSRNVLTVSGTATGTLDFSRVAIQNLADEVISVIISLYDGSAGMLDQFATWVAVAVEFDAFAKENGLTSFTDYNDEMRERFMAFLTDQFGKDSTKYFPFCELVLNKIKGQLIDR